MRDYFKDTATPHFFNVAIRCIVLIKTAFSQARHPSSSFLRDKILPPRPPPPHSKNPNNPHCVQLNYQGTQSGDQETDLIYHAGETEFKLQFYSNRFRNGYKTVGHLSLF